MYICTRCQKEFKQKTDFTRHKKRKNPCVKTINEKDSEMEMMKKSLNEMHAMITKLVKSNKKLTKKINRLERESKNKSITIMGDVNINITTHGQEDLSFLTTQQIKSILNRGILGVNKFVELVHCNKDKPEYQNIYISNRKNMDRNIMVFNNNKW